MISPIGSGTAQRKMVNQSHMSQMMQGVVGSSNTPYGGAGGDMHKSRTIMDRTAPYTIMSGGDNSEDLLTTIDGGD